MAAPIAVFGPTDRIVRGGAVAKCNADGSISITPAAGQATAVSSDLNVTKADGGATILSGATGNYSHLRLGRDTVQSVIASPVAGAYLTDAAAGDLVIRNEGAGSAIRLGFGSGTATSIAFAATGITLKKETDYTVTIATSTTAATAGGNLTVSSGAGATTAAGGTLALTGGQGGATGAGGPITATTGAGGSTSGLSGALTLATGTTAAESASASGEITAQTGLGSNSTGATNGGASGALTVQTQNGGTSVTGTGGAAGTVSLTGGAGGAASGAATGGAGAAINLTAGRGGNGGTASGAPGAITLTAGSAGTGGAVAGGAISLTAGRSVGGAAEGAITLVTGGSTRLTVAGTGAVTIAAPTSGVGLTVSGGGANITGTLVVSGASLSVGTTPATAGAIRIPNAVSLQARNAANTLNLPLIGADAGDLVTVGGANNNGLYLYSPANVYLQPGGATAVTFATGAITLADATNIVLNATTGTKIGTATTQKLAFYNATPIVQGAAVADASGGATIDAEARTAINALLARIRATGLIAT